MTKYCARCQHNEDRHLRDGCAAKTKSSAVCKCPRFVETGKRFSSRVQADDSYLAKLEGG